MPIHEGTQLVVPTSCAQGRSFFGSFTHSPQVPFHGAFTPLHLGQIHPTLRAMYGGISGGVVGHGTSNGEHGCSARPAAAGQQPVIRHAPVQKQPCIALSAMGKTDSERNIACPVKNYKNIFPEADVV